jgi:hypothetical protein
VSEEQCDVIAILSKLIASLPQIRRIQLVRTPHAPKAQTRLADEPEALPLLDRGAQLRKIEGLPFWDTVLLAAERHEGGLSDALAQGAIFHQALCDDPTLTRLVDDNLDDWLRQQVATGAEDEVLAFSSRVTLNGEISAHIPMLDFSARTDNSGSLKSARAILKQLGHPGTLLTSGRSFHFYGQKLLSQDELAHFLGQALLFAPLVDGRWVAHQLINGFCALRISKGRDGSLPATVHL